MKLSSLSFLSATVALVALSALPTLAQTKYYPDRIVRPASGSLPWANRHTHVHTNVEIMRATNKPNGRPAFTGLGVGGGFSPGQMRKFYGVTATHLGSGSIAIVDAYDYTAAVADYNVFAAQYGWPQETGNGANVKVVYATGSAPANGSGSGWDLEASLDIQAAKSMAPHAQVILVEAASNSFADMFYAVSVARSLPNVREVSMSWSGGEAYATGYESNLTGGHGINFASSGDGGAFYWLYGNYEGYPSSSPNVVSVGGTTLTTKDPSGLYNYEIGWESGGGGPSTIYTKPSYQVGIAGTDSTFRSTPDMAANADPNTPFTIYNSTYYGAGYWFYIGGTSEACPLCAGIQNASGHSYSSTAAFLAFVYANLDTAGYYNDIKYGYNGFTAGDDYDMVTGVGSPHGTNGM